MTQGKQAFFNSKRLTNFVSYFFGWRLLGLIPGGTPFSQLNKDVRDVMSATIKRDVKHQVCTKTCKRPQVPTSSKHRKEGRVSKGAKKRAPVKSKGKHLCQSGKMQPRKRALVKPEGSTCAGARSARERQERTKVKTSYKGWWPLKEVFVGKPNLRQNRNARKTLKQFQSRK